MAKKTKKRGVKPGTKRGPYRGNKKGRKKKVIHNLDHGLNVGDKVKIDMNTWRTIALSKNEEPSPVKSSPKSFADCMFEITNSNMEQSVKQEAFKALKYSAKSEVFKGY